MKKIKNLTCTNQSFSSLINFAGKISMHFQPVVWLVQYLKFSLSKCINLLL